MVRNLVPEGLLLQQRVEADQNGALGSFSEVQSSRLNLTEDSPVTYRRESSRLPRAEHRDPGAAFVTPAFRSSAVTDYQQTFILDSNLHLAGPAHVAS